MPVAVRIIAVICCLLAMQTAAWAGPAPRGNNGNIGVVKIATSPSDRSPSNQPHVGCVFDIDFFNYDDGDLWAEHSVRLHPPTGRRQVVQGTAFIGEDRARGGRDHDATLTVDVAQALEASGFDPHDRQGWHMKVTVHADASQGSDVKHKVFWSRCSRSAGVAATGPPGPQPVRAAGVAAPVGEPGPATRVLGAETRPDRPPATPARASRAVSGLALTSARTLVPMGLGLTLLVSGLLLGARLKRRAAQAARG